MRSACQASMCVPTWVGAARRWALRAGQRATRTFLHSRAGSEMSRAVQEGFVPARARGAASRRVSAARAACPSCLPASTPRPAAGHATPASPPPTLHSPTWLLLPHLLPPLLDCSLQRKQRGGGGVGARVVGAALLQGAPRHRQLGEVAGGGVGVARGANGLCQVDERVAVAVHVGAEHLERRGERGLLRVSPARRVCSPTAAPPPHRPSPSP